MDERANLREILAQLTVQARVVEDQRHSVEVALNLLDLRAGGSKTTSTYTGPDKTTNVGRAIEFLRATPNGLTLAQIIEKSAENGGKAMVSTSISSQLRFQVKRGIIKKVGDVYHAVAR